MTPPGFTMLYQTFFYNNAGPLGFFTLIGYAVAGIPNPEGMK